MEHRGGNGHHYGQSGFDHNIFCYRNQFQRMLGNSNGDSFRRSIADSHCHCISRSGMPRWIQHANGNRRRYLSMEHRGNNYQRYSQSGFNHNVFGHGNQFRRLFWHCIGDGYGRVGT